MLVIKCGGAAGIDVEAICADVARLRARGEQIVLVHGGSTAANDLGDRLGIPPRFITSVSGVRSRYTDERTLDVLTMALAGHLNPRFVARLRAFGANAIGLSGVDGGLVLAKRKPSIRALVDGRTCVIRDDLTGRIEEVNSPLLRTLLESGYLPVLSPPALDVDTGPVNVDADRLAAAVAAAMGAEQLILLSNTPGLLRDQNDPSTLVEMIPSGALDRCFGLATGRMKLKLIAAREALEAGVQRVIIADGRRADPILSALAGRGTLLDGGDAELAA